MDMPKPTPTRAIPAPTYQSDVVWSIVDGVPDTDKPDPKVYNVEGFRGGQTEPGDDVGLWTSLAIDAGGKPAVAYYDRTNKGLKMAQLIDGTWRISSVERKDRSDIGRYAKLQFVSGNPVIAYLYIEPGGENGALKSGVRVARAASGTPGEGDWTFEDVSVDTSTPCRASIETVNAVPNEEVLSVTCIVKCSSSQRSSVSGRQIKPRP